MKELKNDKTARVLRLYTKLMNGCTINKTEEAQNSGVNERSIQRDIDDIRNFLENEAVNDGYINSVIYDRQQKGYRMERIYRMKLSTAKYLPCVKFSSKAVLSPKKKFIDTMWDIGQAIRNCQYIEIDYLRSMDKKVVQRKVKPVAIMFSEFYFYLTAFIDDEEVQKNFDVINDSFPTIYRIDRIKKLTVLDEKFHIPYSSRFEEGEFRKRVQFMYGGKLQKIRFKYSGPDVDSVLDRLPTAKILKEEDGAYTISAEVFGKGVEMWIRSQGDMVSLL